METIGNLIDKLTIVNIRIWMAEDIKRDKNSLDSEIVRVTKLTNIANQQRNDIIQEIDERINDLILNNKIQKLYKQGDNKMYGSLDFPDFTRHLLAWKNSLLQTALEKHLQCDYVV